MQINKELQLKKRTEFSTSIKRQFFKRSCLILEIMSCSRNIFSIYEIFRLKNKTIQINHLHKFIHNYLSFLCPLPRLQTYE